jgi:GTPase SAR1 family protein
MSMRHCNSYQVKTHDWYAELREHCENIPCILVANKVDMLLENSKRIQFCIET